MNDIEFERQLQDIREGKQKRLTENTPCSAIARKHMNELSRYVRALETGYNTVQAKEQIHARCAAASGFNINAVLPDFCTVYCKYYDLCRSDPDEEYPEALLAEHCRNCPINALYEK